MKIGYARMPTAEQNLDLQRDALEGVGCKRIYEEQASGKNTERPALTSCLKALRSGDVLVVLAVGNLTFRGFSQKYP
jgi:DNA invertase Pin-like site-specific DNA recombinase